MSAKPKPPRTIYKLTKVHDIYVNMESFESKIDKQENGCWIWKGARHNQGYGMVSVLRGKDYKRTMTVVHRVTARLKYDKPLGHGDDIIHTCGNNLCCNPDHLVLRSDYEDYVDELDETEKTY